MNGHRAREEGAVAIITAIVLLLFMGIAALAIDAGRAYIERSNAQNAADHAALAAAWSWCNSTGTETERIEAARTAGEVSAARNGYTDGVVLDPYADRSKWSATVTNALDAPFARAARFGNSLTVAANADSSCRPGAVAGQNYAIYAHGTCGNSDETVDLSGSNMAWIYGNVHSNGGFKDGGQNIHVYGQGTYITDSPPAGDKIKWYGPDGLQNGPSSDNPKKLASAISTWPVYYNLDDYKTKPASVPASEHFYRSGDLVIDSGFSRVSGGVIQDGIYYATGKLEIKVDGLKGNATFVSETEIIHQAKDTVLNPYIDDLLMFGNLSGGCAKEAVVVSGNDNNLNGTLFAPRSAVSVPGQGNHIKSIIAMRAKLHGSNTMVGNPGGFDESDPEVTLDR
jgi:hypothetical protein